MERLGDVVREQEDALHSENYPVNGSDSFSMEELKEIRVKQVGTASANGNLTQPSSSDSREDFEEVGLKVGGLLRLNGSFKGIDYFNENPTLYERYVIGSDSMFDDLAEKIVVSRMVNESIIKGMVKAVTEEADEALAAKDTEIEVLRERLRVAELEITRLQNFNYESVEFKAGSNSLFVNWENESSCTKALELEYVIGIQEAVTGVVVEGYIYNCGQFMEESLLNKTVCLTESNDWQNYVSLVSNLHKDLERMYELYVGADIIFGPLEASMEAVNGHVKANLNRRAISERISPTSLSKYNGSVEKNSCDIADFGALKHMKPEELYNFLKGEIINRARNHESALHEKTEECFKLWRQLLKEKDSVHPKQEKEFDVLRKNMADVKSRLEDVVKQLDKFSWMVDDHARICSSAKKLLKENKYLEVLLSDKKKEIRHLSSQASEASKKVSEYSSLEAKLKNQIRKCKIDADEHEMEFRMREAIYMDVLRVSIHKHELESIDSDLEAIVMNELKVVILEAAFADLKASAEYFMGHNHEEFEHRIYLEAFLEVSDHTLLEEIERNQGLQAEIRSLSASMKRKEDYLHKQLEMSSEELDKLSSTYFENVILLDLDEVILKEAARDAKFVIQSSLQKYAKEKEIWQSEVSSLQKALSISKHETEILRVQIEQNENVIVCQNEKLQSLTNRLDDAVQQLALYEKDRTELDKKLHYALVDLDEACKERTHFEGILSRKKLEENEILVKEREHQKQLEIVGHISMECTKIIMDFESRLAEVCGEKILTLQKLNDELHPLIQCVGLLRKRGTRCKRILSDLQKAEAEVDLLGDEVDSLLRLLEKIYIALDYYSPVLKFYPGIMDILDLVRKELKVEKSLTSRFINAI